MASLLESEERISHVQNDRLNRLNSEEYSENSKLDEEAELELIDLEMSRSGQIDKALERLNRLANHGSTRAMLRYAELFENSRIFEQDFAKARGCLIEADRLGSGEASFRLGRYYRLGLGVPVDLKTADQYFKKAAQRGILRAVYQSAVIAFELGHPSEGVRLLRLSINVGVAAARYDYAVCLLNGVGVQRDPQKALRLLNQLSEEGDREAAEKLVWIYSVGDDQIEPDVRKAEQIQKRIDANLFAKPQFNE